MRRFLLSLIALAAALLLSAQWSQDRADYIVRYAPYAVEEMLSAAVPASVTLAQAVLESGAGKSALSLETNNHFGIQCHKGWKGKYGKAVDNGELRSFRAYDNVRDSYADHSEFLRGNRRYHPLFELKITDYKGWCNGLKQAGYAEDPAYPKKLIDIIETYDLSRYDKMGPSDLEDLYAAAEALSSGTPAVKKEIKQESKKEQRRAAKRKRREAAVKGEGYEEIKLPEPPAALEAPKPATREEVHSRTSFSLSRPMFTQNGALFVTAVEGETYASLARSFNLFEKEILRFNDLSKTQPLKAGERVYIEAKRSQTRRGVESHVVEAGETMRSIAQDFGVKEKSLRKLNGFAADEEPEEGDQLRLRKRTADEGHWWQFWK